MKKFIRDNILTVFFLGVLLCYQGGSIFNPEGFHFKAEAQTSFIELHLGDWVSKKLNFLSFGNLKFGESFDHASRWIKERGYVYRYIVRQLPDFVLLGRREEYREFFLREEVCVAYRKIHEERIQSGRWIAKFISKMQKRGVTVIVVGVPTKVAIDRESLPKTLPSCALWGIVSKNPQALKEDEYGNYEAVIEADPSHMVDLYGAYEKYLNKHPGEYLYVPSDSHWSSLGISLAAQTVIDRLGGLGWPVRASSLELKSSAPVQGEFIGYLQLPQSYVRHSKDLLWTEPFYTLAGPAPTANGARHGRVILFGTSYSERLGTSEWGFGKILSKRLGRELLDLSFHAAGANGSFFRFKKQGYKLRRGDLIVWEYPARHTPGPGIEIPELKME